jgi:DNA replication protein DnaC
MFLIWRDLLSHLRDEYREGQGEASLLYKRATRVAVLAIDDLGAERPTPWALEALASLVQARYDHQLPTIVTSNFSTAELTVRLSGDDEVAGRRIVNRLVDGGVGIRFDGASRRRAG